MDKRYKFENCIKNMSNSEMKRHEKITEKQKQGLSKYNIEKNLTPTRRLELIKEGILNE
ncbi:MAG: hypothetical protein AABY07_10970 [Nanoarchaeota archaeon]